MECNLTISWPGRLSDTGVYDRWEMPSIQDMARTRSGRVILLVLVIWVLNGFDLAFTVLAQGQGMLQEANPVVALILGYGPSSVIAYKVALLLIGTYPLLRFRRQRLTELASITIAIAYAILAVQWSLCYELYLAAATDSIPYTRIEQLLRLAG